MPPILTFLPAGNEGMIVDNDFSSETHGTIRHAVLDQYAMLSLRGDDAVSFLQGQVCGDLEGLAPDQSMITAVTNPRGRVIAVVRVLRHRNGCDLVLPSELSGTLAQRLKMYVLRAKVDITAPANNITIAGIWGSGLPDLRAFATGPGDAQPGILQLPGAALLLISDADSSEIAKRLCAISMTATFADWVESETISGLPEIAVATSESFLPQMLNLDLLNGVSYSKGCYVGQEVIARAHHLGKVKRRSRLFYVSADNTPADGQSVMQGDRAVGKVVRVARAEDGFFLLAVTPTAQGLSLDCGDAPELEERPLPYDLPD
jgi:folate-binding protein YgfZ